MLTTKREVVRRRSPTALKVSKTLSWFTARGEGEPARLSHQGRSSGRQWWGAAALEQYTYNLLGVVDPHRSLQEQTGKLVGLNVKAGYAKGEYNNPHTLRHIDTKNEEEK